MEIFYTKPRQMCVHVNGPEIQCSTVGALEVPHVGQSVCIVRGTRAIAPHIPTCLSLWIHMSET